MMLNIAKTDFWDVIRVRIPYWNEASQGQQGALLSFAYNVGAEVLWIAGFRHHHASLERQGLGRGA